MGLFQIALIGRPAILTSDSSSEFININTLFWVVVILAVLIIIVLAYLISIKSQLTNSSPVEVKSISPVDNVIAQIVKSEEEELANNLELVAVITAAIQASMGDDVPAGGFVVRSIRKAR